MPVSSRMTAEEMRAERRTATYRQAFRSYLMGHNEGGTDLIQVTVEGARGDQRALSVLSGTGGAYLIPTEAESGIMVAASEVVSAPMRRLASKVVTTGGGDYLVPFSADTAVGRRVEANGAISENDPSVGVRKMVSFLYSSDLVKVSVQLLQDGIAVEEWLSRVLGQRIGRAQNRDFTIGAESAAPLGVTISATLAVTGQIGSTTTVSQNDLLDMQDGCASPHRHAPEACYMMAADTLQATKRQLDASGRNIITNELRNGRRVPVFDGYTIEVNDDMPTMAAGARSVLFGNFSQYIVRDVGDIAVARLTELYAANMQVGFLSFWRSDGLLIDPAGNAVVYYQNSDS